MPTHADILKVIRTGARERDATGGSAAFYSLARRISIASGRTLINQTTDTLPHTHVATLPVRHTVPPNWKRELRHNNSRKNKLKSINIAQEHLSADGNRERNVHSKQAHVRLPNCIKSIVDNHHFFIEWGNKIHCLKIWCGIARRSRFFVPRQHFRSDRHLTSRPGRTLKAQVHRFLCTVRD